MKGFLIFVALAVAVQGRSTQNSEVVCPPEQAVDWSIELLLPHEQCNSYYQCTLGEPVARRCPRGLFFNVRTSECDWPANVDCRGREIPRPPKPTRPDAEIPEEGPLSAEESVEKLDLEAIERLPNGCPVDPSINLLVADEKRCDVFYYCVLGERVATRCPRKLHFNVAAQVCDYPYRAGCDAKKH